MDNYINRLVTFTDWPDNITVSVLALSQAGFYYTGREDAVQCFLCKVVINKWKNEDDPYIKHIHVSPMCSFARQKYSEIAYKYRNSDIGETFKENKVTTRKIAVKEEQKSKEAENKPIPKEIEYNDPETITNPTENLSLNINSKLQAITILPKQQNSKEITNSQSKNGVRTIRQNGQFPFKIDSNLDAMNILQKQSEYAENSVIHKRPISKSTNDIDFTVEANRLSSFINDWPLDAPISPKEIAATGMYYTGPGDRVQCAWCRGGLYNWEERDIPIEEHKRHFPKCAFLASRIGEQQNGATAKPQGITLVGVDDVSTEATNNCLQHHEIAKKPVEFPAMRIAKDMGFSADLINKAADIVHKKYGFVHADQLMDILFELESEGLNNDNDDEAIPIPKAVKNISQQPLITHKAVENFTPQAVQEISPQTIQNRSINSKPDASTISDKELSLEEDVSNEEQICHLKEENCQLKETTTCKICLDQPVSVLFLPCRHLVCCQECADNVKQCPVCRTMIVGTIDTLL